MRAAGRLILLSLLVALLSPLAALAQPAPAQDPGQSGLAKAMKAQNKHTDALLALSGVVGTATGLGPDGKPAVKVFVKEAGLARIPAKVDEVPTVVEVTGEIVAQSDPPLRPAPIGVSSGSERLTKVKKQWYCTVGTLGARVKDGDGVLYALSNNHVYALENKGLVGDRILQPGRVDMTSQACGSEQEINSAVIGTLSTFIPITFSRNARNEVDAAIAVIYAGLVGNATPADGYGTPSSTVFPSGEESLSIGKPVQKYGRTTGLTFGTIAGINATILVKYDSGVARFVKQIQITGGGFSAAGDSGSLIVTDTSPARPVALLFAGSGTTTFGNPIGLVLTKFGVTIDGPP